MANNFGYNTSLTLKEAVTYNAQEDMSTGTRYGIYTKAGITLNKVYEQIMTEHLRQSRFAQIAESQHGLVDVNGNFQAIGQYNGALGILLKHLLGKVVTSGGPEYVHTLTYNPLIFVGLSFAENKIGATWNYHGMQINSCKVSTNIGEPLVFDFGFNGASAEIVAAIEATAPSAPLAADPYMMGHHCTIKLATVAYGFTGFDWVYTPGLEIGAAESYSLGSSARAVLLPTGGNLAVTLRRRVLKDALSGEGTRLREILDLDSSVACEITIQNPTDADFSLVFNFTFKVDDVKDEVAGPGTIMEEATCRDVILDDASSTIILNDDFTGPATATGTYAG